MIQIRRMTTGHLLRTIHYLERTRYQTLIDLYEQAMQDGGSWQESLEYYDEWPVMYPELLAEARHRKLMR